MEEGRTVKSLQEREKQKMKICDHCKKDFSTMIERADGLPNGVTFQLRNGRTINVCTECVQELGRLREAGDKEGIEAFYRKAGM